MASPGDAYQTTAAWVYHCVEGSGSTIINGQKMTWKAKDTFVARLLKHEHKADEDCSIQLYRSARAAARPVPRGRNGLIGCQIGQGRLFLRDGPGPLQDEASRGALAAVQLEQ